MTSAAWETPDFDDDDASSPGRPAPTLVSLHFLRSALRRRFAVCILCAVLGLLTAAAFLAAFPAPHNAKAVMLLAHDPQADPSRAMTTDVSLLMTRIVAENAIKALGPTAEMTNPDDLLNSVTVEQVSSDLIALTLDGPTNAEAERRLEVFASAYLQFRAEQLSVQSDVLVNGMRQHIEKLQAEVGDLTRRIDQLSAAESTDSSNLSDAISQRAYITGRIEALQQQVEDQTLRTESIVSASRVIDPPAAETGGVKRRIAFALVSGLIGGAALGCGAVLFMAVTSDRLRRRFDVAAALDAPVSVSVGKIEPLPRRWRWLPHLRTVDVRRANERQRLARAIEMELPLPGRWGRLAVACIDNADEIRFAMVTAAADIAANRESRVQLIDLTEHGGLDAAVAQLIPGDSPERPNVLRPQGIPALAGGPAELRTVGQDADEQAPNPADLTDVYLVLADLEPSVGADHLAAWTNRVVVTVTSGRSSAERVRTAGDLIRGAGLELRFVALLHADATDNSSGTTVTVDRPGTQLGDVHGAIEPATDQSGAR